MTIRTYQPGDESAQVSIYNEAAGALPRFKAASLDEVRRRCHAPEFDPTSRFFALDSGGRAVGYCGFHPNGRLSYPWCRAGHGSNAEPLLQAALDAMRARGQRTVFAAYRGDWPEQKAFFLAHGFTQVREMVNFVLDVVEMPTPAARPSTLISPALREEVPAIMALAPSALRVSSAQEFERHLLENPHFSPASVFVMRGRSHGAPVGAAILVENPAYAHPRQVDASMPCFRLGAFGTEGMQTKRIHGLFSFLASPGKDVNPLGLDLMGHAVTHLAQTNVETLAAQVPSDVPHLLRFYQTYFQCQGSFPVYGRSL